MFRFVIDLRTNVIGVGSVGIFTVRVESASRETGEMDPEDEQCASEEQNREENISLSQIKRTEKLSHMRSI